MNEILRSRWLLWLCAFSFTFSFLPVSMEVWFTKPLGNNAALLFANLEPSADETWLGAETEHDCWNWTWHNCCQLSHIFYATKTRKHSSNTGTPYHTSLHAQWLIRIGTKLDTPIAISDSVKLLVFLLFGGAMWHPESTQYFLPGMIISNTIKQTQQGKRRALSQGK